MRRVARFALIVFLLGCVTGRNPADEAAGPDRIAAAEGFVDLLVREDFAGAAGKFDARMRGALPASRVRDVWMSVIEKAGGFQSRTRAQQQKVSGYDVVLVTCQFEKMPLDVKVVFDSDGNVGGLFFQPNAPKLDAAPQTPAYVKEGSFHEDDVSVGSGDWVLPGTLTVPVGDGPFPALVLVQGSGPLDRDETIGPNKPFRDLAWGLASRGIAVLRYEKRTKRYGAKIAALASVTVKEETVDDALAGVRLVRSAPRIDPKRVFVLGHSLGGMLAPRIGGLDAGIAGLIVLAGTSRPLEDVIVEQLKYLKSVGPDSEELTKKLAEMEAQAAKVRALDPSKADPAERIMGVPAGYWLDLRGYHPAEAASELKQPMLILQGERDYQVTMVDFRTWKDALAGRQDVVFKTYPDLNHLFVTGQGRSTPSEYEQPGHVAQAVVDDIAAWIVR